MPPSTVTSLGLIGKVTSLIFGKTTKVTSFLQKPTTVALLGITSKFTKTLPLPKPGKTILSILKPKPLPLGPKPKTAKTTFKITKTIIKPKGTSTSKPAAVVVPGGKASRLTTFIGATKPPPKPKPAPKPKTPAPPKPKKGDAAAAGFGRGGGVGVTGLGGGDVGVACCVVVRRFLVRGG